jgi:adenosylcobinamide-GDP ribazoletransferase
VKLFSPRPARLSNFGRFALVSGLFVAARYLTILPLPGRSAAGLTGLGRAAAWFPVVGFALGVTLVVADHWLVRLFPGLLGALLTVTLWKTLTGGLHLDGLADCLDGLGGRDPNHRRAIMSDSRLGTFGTVGLILFLMIEIVALADLDGAVRWGALLAAPAIVRATSPLLAWLYPAAPGNGQGAAFASEVRGGAVGVALLLACVVAVLALGAAGVAMTVVAVVVAALGARFMVGRLGGITGDVLGAAVETAELTAVLAVTAWPR